MKLNRTHQLLVYVDDVNTVGGSIRPVKKNTAVVLVDSNEIGLKVNADKTKYKVMSRDQNAGRSHKLKTDNSSFQKVKEFKYLGTT